MSAVRTATFRSLSFGGHNRFAPSVDDFGCGCCWCTMVIRMAGAECRDRYDLPMRWTLSRYHRLVCLHHLCQTCSHWLFRCPFLTLIGRKLGSAVGRERRSCGMVWADLAWGCKVAYLLYRAPRDRVRLRIEGRRMFRVQGFHRRTSGAHLVCGFAVCLG